MSAGTFTPAPLVRDLEDGVRQQLQEPLAHVTADGLWTIVVPAGFITDYASIPQVLHSVLPPRGKGNRANIVHDYLYRYAPRDPRTGASVTQATADRIKLEGDAILGERWTRRWAMYVGLRVGGWVTWRRYRIVELVGGAAPV
jgi:Protein of unknown function (DUF1353)